ncbi:MAG TPA: DNA polymerase III subunit delta [Pseudomonadales bacterium]|nr:DNA polymerase III subunit delta [Pseudomonadales bacterium]
MRLRRPEDLDEALAGGLAPVYLITGDEPLLVQEAADSVRAAARTAGIDEREVFHVEGNFDWQEMLQSAGSMSLFSSRRLLELRCKSASLGKEGAAAVTDWANAASGDDVLMILMPRIDARSQKAKWYTTLEKTGVVLPVWPVALDEMGRWLATRLRRAGVRVDDEGMDLLVARLEGNLLAAAQMVTRLSLSGPQSGHEGAWTAGDLLEVLDDDSRYTPFELADRMLAGDAEHAHRILRTLRAEGSEPLALVAVLARDMRLLRTLRAAHEIDRLGVEMKAQRVFQRRQGLVKQAVTRLPMALLDGALRDLAIIDQSVKGLLPIDPWDELDRLILRVAGKRTTPLGIRARAWLELG